MCRFILTAAVLVLLCGCQPEAPDRRRSAPAHQVYAFTADWCAGCRRDKPRLADLERRGVKVVRIDCDSRPDLVAKYKIKRLPTYIVLKDGKEVKRTTSILILIKILRFLLRLRLL